MGAKKRPFYRIVVADSRSARDGRIIEVIGRYDPMTEPRTVHVDEDKAKTWLEQGAQPSDTARRLLVEAGVLADKQKAAVSSSEGPVAESDQAAEA